jgi:vancomycin resistance protein YoaR
MERFFAPIKQSLSGRAVKKSEHETEFPHVVFLDLQKPRRPWVLLGASLCVVAVLLLSGVVFTQWPKFLPGTTIENISVGGETVEMARVKLEHAALVPPAHTIELSAQETLLASSSAELGAQYQYQETLESILEKQRRYWLSWLGQVLFSKQTPQSAYLPVFYDPEKLSFLTEQLKQQFDTPPHFPDVELRVSGAPQTLTVDAGTDTFSVNTEETLKRLKSTLTPSTDRTTPNPTGTIQVSATIDQTSKQLTEEEQAAVRARGEKFVGKTLVFNKDHLQQALSDTTLVSLLAVPSGYDQTAIDEVLTAWSETFNRPPQNAELAYESETLRVTNFKPPRNGLTLNIPAMKQAIIAAAEEIEHAEEGSIPDGIWKKDLLLAETPPEITLADTNNLGINERIGFGESYYYHSIPNRVHNVSLTAQKINLAIVPPGKEFSFNQTLGDVSAATGFRSAYVIKDGRTALGDGGGVCQVSTTLFRALLDAGLNITRRLQHSYRVSYYELDNQPGFDATVYAGNVDLRFINDTTHHVLIYTETDPENLHMFVELYGTSDGRTTEITNYQSWDARPPLPTEYIPDPSLAPGQLRQVDWSASGIKTQFTHIVRDKDGNVTSEKNYYSNYRPWSAKFLQGI